MVLKLLLLISIVGFSLYGLHRLHLLRLWYRYRSPRGREPAVPKATEEKDGSGSLLEHERGGRGSGRHPVLAKPKIGRRGEEAASSDEVPFVTIQLPLYNERMVAKRLIRTAAEMDYPRDRFEIQVLDDSTDATREVVDHAARDVERKGISIRVIRRSSRAGFKAGALQEGLRKARGELVAVFDADFLPPRDFLARTVPFFRDSRIGMVQGRWTFLNEDDSFLTRAQALSLNGHFRLEHFVRCAHGCFFNFNGTAGIWRAETIHSAGGWNGGMLTEDLDLSYRAQMAGWRFLYLDDLECASELPPTYKAFKSQQFRWMKGMAQVARNLLPSLLRARLPFRVKAEAVAHLLAPMTYSLALASFLLFLPLLSLLHEAGAAWKAAYAIALGSTTVIVGLFHYVADGRPPLRRFLGRFLALLVLGVGNSLNATRAVLEGFLGIDSPFVRTPKYGRDGSAPAIGMVWYRMRLDRLIVAEAVLGLYGLFTIIASVLCCLFVTPWALLFTIGWFAMTVGQVRETLTGNA
ncbi:MAG: glycosyltransferase [Candidatus Hydrogenedentota bacterium]|nr:MAG: glycosyltransferase [Candidatus Hydrogenedentota bacterium]